MNYPYVPARYQFPRRRGVTPTLLVIHSMESSEKGDTAEACARYFKFIKKAASAHLCIDNNSIVQSVPYNLKAAGAAGGPYRAGKVNDYAIHFEHAGFARQTPADWSDPYSVQMLFWSAIAAAKVCKQFGIPVVDLSPQQLRQGHAGICTHKDVTDAFNVRDGHWDPGPGFPMNSYVSNVAFWMAHA